MADVADGRFRADAWPGASLHRAGERAGPRLWSEALHGRDAPALRRLEQAAREPRVRRRSLVGRRLRHPRLGLAPPAPQGGACRLPLCEALVRAVDGAPGGEARDGREAGLRWFVGLRWFAPPAATSSPSPRSYGERVGVRGCCRANGESWTRGDSPSPDLLRKSASPRKRG